jgi:hypothetical protein
MAWYRRFLVVVFVLVNVAGVVSPRAQEAPGTPAAPVIPATGTPPVEAPKDDPLTTLQDPRALADIGKTALAAGDAERARKAFEATVDRDELALYLKMGKTLREALVLEYLGDFAGAEKSFRTSADKDLLYTILVLRIASQHPSRDALVDEFVGRVKAKAAATDAGAKDQVIYVTSKGEPRFLEKVEPKDVLTRLRAVEGGDDTKKLRYCYIPVLDLTGVDPTTLPHRMQFSQCVIGRVRIPDLSLGQLVISGFVLGDFEVGKTWEGQVNTSKAYPGSHFEDVSTRETVFLGRANFQDVTITGRKAAFPLTVFEGGADFRGARFLAPADFRFSVFGADANFKGARIETSAMFGNARFRKETTFTGLYAERDVYFNSDRFEGPVHFDDCEWQRAATFENSQFSGPVSFTSTRIRGRLNMSRAVFEAPLDMKEVFLGGMDFFGAELREDARFADARFDGKVRFSLDDMTRAHHREDPTPLLALYRDYQGDEDADEPLSTASSYGVDDVDDLTAHIGSNLSFANSVFGGFVVFEGITFGTPGEKSVAEFYNTQFLGETHFERTTFVSKADFSTIYASELAMNEADFLDTLVLDDANVPGRVSLTDATFGPDATLSFYGAEIGTFQVARDQIEDEASGRHRLWYERCAGEDTPLEGEIRLSRRFLDKTMDPDAVRADCYDRAIDEYVSLKQSFGDRAMTSDEDWAYWWIKHHETFAGLRWGGVGGVFAFPIRWFLFELAFGWGVRLENLALTALVVCAAFTVVYKLGCPDTIISFDGEDTALRDVPWIGVFYISLQSLGSFNTGWDFGRSETRFKYLNTLHTFGGIIILTFFVGAYTRMILA